MDWRPSASLAVLQQRARLLERIRGFFSERGLLEVDTPVLQGGANVDPGSQSHPVLCGSEARFLPTSPEHPLKRLVAAGYGPVWTLAPAFRMGERSRRHQPEFRMLEWYRPGWDDLQIRTETVALIDHLTGWGTRCTAITYREAFQRWCDIDLDHLDTKRMATLLGDSWTAVASDTDAALDLLLATRIEPHLGRDGLTAITDYPLRLAAQARGRPDAQQRQVAARFELYRDGIELANGYWELTDSVQLRSRLHHELGLRGDGILSPDNRFEAAMTFGLPDCAGVAIGFDRLLMLHCGLDQVSQTMAFPWDLA